MEAFWKAAGIIMMTVILSVVLRKSQQEFSLVLTLTACCAVILVASQYLKAIIDFLWRLGNAITDLNPFTSILLKITGAALATEFTCHICADTGNSSMGKMMQILGNIVILFLSLPVFESFLAVIQDIMGMI